MYCCWCRGTQLRWDDERLLYSRMIASDWDLITYVSSLIWLDPHKICYMLSSPLQHAMKTGEEPGIHRVCLQLKYQQSIKKYEGVSWWLDPWQTNLNHFTHLGSGIRAVCTPLWPLWSPIDSCLQSPTSHWHTPPLSPHYCLLHPLPLLEHWGDTESIHSRRPDNILVGAVCIMILYC